MTKSASLSICNCIIKEIFGDQKYSDLVIDFLSLIIKTNKPIVSTKLGKEELLAELGGETWPALNISVTTHDQEIIHVVIKMRDEKITMQDILFDWTKLFASQITHPYPNDDDFNNLKRTVAINITDINMFKDDQYWHTLGLIDPEDKTLMTDLLEIHFLSLADIPKLDENSQPLEIWLRFLQDPYSEEANECTKKALAIAKAKNIPALGIC